MHVSQVSFLHVSNAECVETFFIFNNVEMCFWYDSVQSIWTAGMNLSSIHGLYDNTSTSNEIPEWSVN